MKSEIRKHGAVNLNPVIDAFYIVRILQACIENGYFKPDSFFLRNQKSKEVAVKTTLKVYGLQEFLHGRMLEQTAASESIQASEVQEIQTGKNETEKKIQIDSSVQKIQENKKDQKDYTLNHSFEKIETLEEFKGNWRDFDGKDEIEDHSDALDELQFNQVIRTEEQSAGFLKSDQSAGFASELIGETRGPFLYPEWDYRKNAFRPDYCSVTELKAGGSANGAEEILKKNNHTFLKLKHDLDRIWNRFSPQPRQVQGDDIDLDAAVDYLIDRAIGHTPSEKLYRKRRRNMREIDLLLLLDQSLSTDSYKRGIRVIDAEREAMILFGEALTSAGLEFACYSFSSKTRHHCQVRKLHGFEENWIYTKSRLLNLEPTGYTRIGPALRHAKSILDQRSGRYKWILLFTDGHPNDYDQYEGRYGQQDVRHAIQEAEADRIGVHLLSFEKSRDVFGGYAESALDLKRLPDLLMNFYSRISGI